jgi:hypothetical protein
MPLNQSTAIQCRACDLLIATAIRFNRLQIPTIIAVLEKASSQVSNPAQLTIIKELLRFVKNGEGEVHTYLKFIGD